MLCLLFVSCENVNGPNSDPDPEFIDLDVNALDVSRCPTSAVPPGRTSPQAIYVRLPDAQQLRFIQLNDANDDGHYNHQVSEERTLTRGILLMGGYDSNGRILSDMWFLDVDRAAGVNEPGKAPCPWYRFDAGGIPRAEGEFVGGKDGVFLIGGVDEPPGGDKYHTTSSVKFLPTNDPAVQISEWPFRWRSKLAMPDLEERITVDGDWFCGYPVDLTCYDPYTGDTLFHIEFNPCHNDLYDGHYFAEYGQGCDEGTFPLGYPHEACVDDPACNTIDPDGENCPYNNDNSPCETVLAGPDLSVPSQRRHWYKGKGRRSMVALSPPDESFYEILGGVTGCIGSDCPRAERYPDYLTDDTSMSFLSTTDIFNFDGYQWDVGYEAPELRLLGSAGDWLGYTWSASQGWWVEDPDSSPRALIVAGYSEEELIRDWRREITYDRTIELEHGSYAPPTGTEDYTPEPSSTPPDSPEDLKYNTLVYRRGLVEQIESDTPSFYDAAATRIATNRLLVVGGNSSDSQASAGIPIDRRVHRLSLYRSTVRVEVGQTALVAPVVDGQVEADPIGQNAYVFGAATGDVSIVNYGPSLFGKGVYFDPPEERPNECDSSSAPRFVVESTVRVDPAGDVHYNATTELVVRCDQDDTECYLDELKLGLGFGFTKQNSTVMADVTVTQYAPLPGGGFATNGTSSEFRQQGFQPPRANARTRKATLSPPTIDAWPSGSKLTISVDYTEPRSDLYESPLSNAQERVFTAGIQELSASSNCRSSAANNGDCLWFERALPLQVFGKTKNSHVQSEVIEIAGTIQAPASTPPWGIAIPSMSVRGRESTEEVDGIDYLSHRYTLTASGTDLRRSSTKTAPSLMHEASVRVSRTCDNSPAFIDLYTAGNVTPETINMLQDGWVQQKAGETAAMLGGLAHPSVSVLLLHEPNPLKVSGITWAKTADALVYANPGNDPLSTTVHELTHAILQLKDYPSWFEEGTATATENMLAPDDSNNQLDNFNLALRANTRQSGCRLNRHWQDEDDRNTRDYNVAPTFLSLHRAILRANTPSGNQDFWAFWLPFLHQHDTAATTDEIFAYMDAAVPGFSGEYDAPGGAGPRCPGLPVLATTSLTYTANVDPQAPPKDQIEQWAAGSGTLSIRQVQHRRQLHPDGTPISGNDNNWRLFSMVPYSLTCAPFTVDNNPTLTAMANIPLFTACDTRRADITNPITIPSPSSPAYDLFGTRVLTAETEDIPLSINPDAIQRANGNIEPPFPAIVGLVQGPGLNFYDSPQALTRQIWCGPTPCGPDGDGDGYPGQEDCNDSIATVAPDVDEDSTDPYDSDCNCIKRTLPPTGINEPPSLQMSIPTNPVRCWKVY